MYTDTSQAQFNACTPINRIWEVEKKPVGCIDALAFMTASAAINVATDIALLLFPLPLLPLMQFNKRQRSKWYRLFCHEVLTTV